MRGHYYFWALQEVEEGDRKELKQLWKATKLGRSREARP